MTGDAEMARDLAQEIFVKVFRDLQAFRFESGFSSWLYRVAANTCLNALRGRRARREVGIEDVAGADQEIETGRSLEDEQMNRQIQRAVREAILALKTRLRAVEVLWYVEDLSIAELTTCAGDDIPEVKYQSRNAPGPTRRLKRAGRLRMNR